MTPFKMNVVRFNMVQEMLAPHGMIIMQGSVIDETLPIYCNRIVDHIDLKSIDIEKSIQISDFPSLERYLNGGRKEYINHRRNSQIL